MRLRERRRRSARPLAAAVPLRSAPRRRRPTARKPPAPGPAPALKLPAIQKRQLVERPAGLDRRAARSAGRAGQPRRPERHRRRPGGQVRHRQPDGRDAHRRRGHRDRRSRSPTPIDFLGADLDASSGIDSTAVRLHVPVARLGDALPIMADVALRPTFPRDELERLRQQRLTSLLQARDDPATIAGAGVLARALRPDAPLRHRGDGHGGHDQGVHGRRPAGVLQRRPSGPSNATLLVVGDVDAGSRAAAARVELRRAGRRQARRRRRVDAARRRRSPPRATVYLVDKPGAPQSQIRIGWIGVPRSTPDYFPLQVMNTILGGVVQLAAEPEPAREARLHLRRGVVVRHARHAGSVLGDGRRADRQDVGVADRSSSTS